MQRASPKLHTGHLSANEEAQLRCQIQFYVGILTGWIGAKIQRKESIRYASLWATSSKAAASENGDHRLLLADGELNEARTLFR